MRKNSYRSRVANISGAWSASAISRTRAANSALYTPVHPERQQEVVLKQSSVVTAKIPGTSGWTHMRGRCVAGLIARRIA